MEKIVKFLSRADIFFFLLLWLMVLLVIGTVAQKEIGLYMAQEKYFSSSFFLLGGFLPLPGGMSVLCYIFLSLFIKTAFQVWHKKQMGTLVTHIGALMLLAGGFITAIWSDEGYMLIEEGKSLSYVSDYYETEIAIVNAKTNEDIAIFAEQNLQQGAVLKNEKIPFEMQIETYCRNCFVSRTEEKGVTISPKALDKNYEQNVAGAIVEISGLADAEQNGKYAMVDFIPPVRTFDVADKSYKIEIRDKRTYLPFSIHLIDFERKNHPGTMLAKSYKSEVMLEGAEGSWHSLIQMNEPLRYGGYTFYQSSFVEGEEEATVLAVVKNYGRLFPYISSIIMCIGLLIHLFSRLPKLMKKSVACFILSFFAYGCVGLPSALAVEGYTFQSAQTSQPPQVKGFAQLPILSAGRVKPIDTFARAELLSIMGKEKLETLSAANWLEELLFDQKKAYVRKVFNLPNPQLVSALRLKWEEGHRYSFVDVFIGLQRSKEMIEKIAEKDKKDQSLIEKQVLDLNQKALRFYALSRSFSLLQNEFVVEDVENAKKLDVELGVSFDYFKMLSLKDKFIPLIEKMDGALKTEISASEKELLELGYTLKRIGEDEKSDAFKVIPPTVQGVSADGAWTSPWQTLVSGAGSNKTAQLLDLWKTASTAYNTGDQNLYQNTLAQLYAEVESINQGVDSQRLVGEVLYNTYNPFKLSLAFYLATFVTILISTFIFAGKGRLFVYVLGSFGIFWHTLGLFGRIWLMNRPPVATLYESILFVGLICVILSLLMTRKRTDFTGFLMVSLLGSTLQFIGLRYAAEGDTMGMLSAVLNTNFWLATHVVTITIGYGCALVASFMAHMYLVKLLFKSNVLEMDSLLKNIVACVLIALFFAVLGTILGGIWADQSWGRFWGWDPKENGAMFLCLWMIALVHGKLSNLLSSLAFSVLTALSSIVVALAWFGVNLLGVGLHSYGFTENIAISLTLFCLGEFIAVGIFTAFIMLDNKKGDFS